MGVFIILTKGEGTLAHSFENYVPHLGKIEKRQVGSMISGVDGEAIAYALWNLQERGPLFILPQTQVYEGMIIGEHNKGNDLYGESSQRKETDECSRKRKRRCY